ncbi:macro domain-containing protein [Isachenkonia alkalipeptolytica]|uniref:Macro domain-containing protein n=1 Tax=Isachenkonia alkalipeptolytica TaxID=2565777 RepID=A0AA43XKB4_9CLOT|nr:macro domain-containing protein [Isachenkonia alkalipeptolytica]NBG88465.1 macro domain-containing protein [Isachenkonia alkalipeptolytica]
MEKRVDQVVVQCSKGDIAHQEDMEAIVNAANAELRIGGGVAGAIHREAGPKLEKETRKLAPIPPGEAVITGAYNLPNNHVIHCLGPVYGQDKPEDKLLGDCYRKALKIAEEYGIVSIAFPSISTGAFGYPIDEAKKIVFLTIKEVIPTLENVKTIRFVLHNNEDLRVYQEALKKLY